jgi:anaerobic dimethyl sulfoxide reductase subunit B (iron-sulfur subunit)
MGKQLAFHIDVRACADCKACQIACQEKNDLPAHMLWRRVIQYEGGNWVRQGNTMYPNNIFSYSVSIACMHCEKPACVDVCPAGAISKRDDGVVLIDESRCIGCRYCEWACPYGAVHFNEAKGVMTKCTFCADLLEQGQNPACVDACVMRAIEVGELDELRAKYGDVNAIEPLPEAHYTNPAIVITPHKNAQPSEAGTGIISNLAEEV